MTTAATTTRPRTQKTKAQADDAVESAEQRIVEDDDGVIPEGKLE
jgi:segregation and condensation protein B